METNQGYILNKHIKSKKQPIRRYRRQALESMTTPELREICRQEKLNAMAYPLDREALIQLILDFRGEKDQYLLKSYQQAGFQRLQALLSRCSKEYIQYGVPSCSARLTVYEKLAIEASDAFEITGGKDLENTNVFLMSADDTLCGIFQLERGLDGKCYLTKDQSQPCYEAARQDYSLYFVDAGMSERLYHIYMGTQTLIPDHLEIRKLPILPVTVTKPPQARVALVIDFGSQYTLCGIYRDQAFFAEEGYQTSEASGPAYVRLPDGQGGWTPLIPTMAAITAIQGSSVQYAFGQEAQQMAHTANPMEQSSICYDLKHWLNHPDHTEKISDPAGNLLHIDRKDILAAYFQYLIGLAEQQFKCKFTTIHVMYPVKQKQRFTALLQKLLPQYQLAAVGEQLDEGVAALYHTIANAIEKDRYMDGHRYHGLIMDVGAAGSNLLEAQYSIQNKSVRYEIQLNTAYKNGDMDINGRQLTYRLMQLIKVNLVREWSALPLPTMTELAEQMGEDVCRQIDEDGRQSFYQKLEDAYQMAEAVLPTRYADYEKRSREEYYKVRTNFFTLFDLAEQLKAMLYTQGGVRQVVLTSEPLAERGVCNLLVNKWRLSILEQRVERGIEKKQLVTSKYFPTIYLDSSQIDKILMGDVYSLVRSFLADDFEQQKLDQYDVFKLTGGAVKLPLFRQAVTEFVPGKILNFAQDRKTEQRYKTKLDSLNGALRFLYDQQMGYAQIHINSQAAALPYQVTARSHTGEERVMIARLDREKTWGYISRWKNDLALKLYLKDSSNTLRYTYTCNCNPAEFTQITYEEIAKDYPVVRQDDTDNIVNGEIKFFVWAEQEQWGFYVLPVMREEEALHMGPPSFYRFESEEWLQNFFDGKK